MPLNNFGIVNSFVMRSAQPDERGFADLALLGCKHVVKLNSEDDNEAAYCKKHSLNLLLFPIPTFLNTLDVVTKIATAIDGLPHDEIVLVHCTHGRDRGRCRRREKGVRRRGTY